MTQTPPEMTLPCTECQAGQMHQRLITYFTWLNDELITVPNFPAWVCDVCGRREYDSHAISRLSLLLNPDAGKPSIKKKEKHSRTYPKSHRPMSD